MSSATETDQDILLTELLEIHRMIRELNRDIDAGKEPDGRSPAIYREDRGRRMTLKRARGRLHHIEVRAHALGKKLSDSIP